MRAVSLLLFGSLLGGSTVGCFAREAEPEAQKRGQAEYELALDAFKRSSMREALAHVKTALQFDDQNGDAAYLGALVMLVFCADDAVSPDCRYSEAEQYARRALELDPQMRDARNTLGVILIHEGQAKAAVEVLEPLAQDMLYRSPEKAWGNLGWAYLEAGRLPEAVTALQRSVAAQPLFCVGHFRLGRALERQKELVAARQAYSRAVSIEEGSCQRLQEAFLGRGRVALAFGDGEAARGDLSRCQELEPTSAAGRECGAVLRSLGAGTPSPPSP
jgi:Tfp pilus assembly protein PilF